MRFTSTMYYSIGVVIILLFLVLALTVGCASNRAYRFSFNPDDSTEPASNPTNAVIEAGPGYRLGFVEFDDQGWFWDIRQKNAVENLIRKECGIGKTPGKAVVMVLFVHGWKNNAAF